MEMKIFAFSPALVGTLLGACVSLVSPAFAADATQVVGQVVSVTGRVLVRHEAAKTMQMTFLKVGDKIVKGATLNTGAAGAVKLLMSDKTIIDLGPSSLFKVNEYDLKNTSNRKVDLSVDQGSVRASVNEKVNPEQGQFTIRTKAATMGVRGTEFVINAGNNTNTSVTVIKGQVDVVEPNSTTPVKISGGNQFLKEGVKPAIVTKLDNQKIIQIRTQSFQKDTTFLKSVIIDSATNQTQPSGPEGAEPGADRRAGPEGDQPAEGTATTAGEAAPVTAPAPTTAEVPPPPPPGNLAMASIVESVNLSTSTITPMTTTQLQLPGMLPPPLAPPQGVQLIQGLPKNLKVIFTP